MQASMLWMLYARIGVGSYTGENATAPSDISKVGFYVQVAAPVNIAVRTRFKR